MSFLTTILAIHFDLSSNKKQPQQTKVVGIDAENPSLAEKRQRAIATLGDKWLLAKQIQKRA